MQASTLFDAVGKKYVVVAYVILIETRVVAKDAVVFDTQTSGIDVIKHSGFGAIHIH